MQTNIEIDEDLIGQVKERTGLKIKKEVVNKALEAYLAMIRRDELASLAGNFNWIGDLEDMRTDK
jgi:Arc/MetJ family transcription regulator